MSNPPVVVLGQDTESTFGKLTATTMAGAATFHTYEVADRRYGISFARTVTFELTMSNSACYPAVKVNCNRINGFYKGIWIFVRL